MMSVFPVIRQEVDVRYIGFEKPRGDLALLCGEANQSCPQLIFPNGDDAISSDYSMAGTPTLLLIDKQGNLRKHKMGHEDDLILGAELMHLVNEH